VELDAVAVVDAQRADGIKSIKYIYSIYSILNK